MSWSVYPWLLAGMCALALACGSPDAPSVGSETNWLACHSSTDCDDGTDCRCGVCTQTCVGSNDCASMPAASACLETTSLSAEGCRVGFAGRAEGICVTACVRTADCNSGALQCVRGVCVPQVAVTPDGPVSSLPVKDGQATFSAQPRDAGTDGGSATGSGGSATGSGGSAAGSGGNAAGSGGSAADAGLESDAANPADASTSLMPGDGRLGGAVDESGNVYPNPQPMCPCTSDLGDGLAPRVGDVPKNSYGGPLAGVVPTPLELAQGAPHECQAGPLLGPLPYDFTADTSCTHYANCPIACEQDVDCPGGGSGSATPRCSLTRMCFLDCRAGRACPNGMACVTGSDGAGCFWPRDVLRSDCAGYCAAQPPPRECPNWCAQLLVACDPARGVDCCAGLVCTDGGFCDEP